jgi:branched-chain amino acid transport system ATP-binding protein
MLAIGRALMQSPTVLMLDEPTEGLAPVLVQELGRLLRRLGDEGLGILLVEQNLRFALGLAGRVAIMSRGSIVHSDTAANLLKDPNLQSRYFKL